MQTSIIYFTIFRYYSKGKFVIELSIEYFLSKEDLFFSSHKILRKKYLSPLKKETSLIV